MYVVDSGEREVTVVGGFGEAALQVLGAWRSSVELYREGEHEAYYLFAGRSSHPLLVLCAGMSLDEVRRQLAGVFAQGKACIIEQYPPYGDVVVHIAAGVDPLDAVYALDSAPFVQWWNRNKGALGALHITKVEITRVEYWGLEPGMANVREIDVLVFVPHLSHPWRATLGNDSVGVYLRAWCAGVPYVVAIAEPRIPIARAHNIGLVAGMLDGGDPRTVAVREAYEEAGVEVDPERLMRISPPGGIALSPGARSEHMHFFVYDFQITEAERDRLDGRVCGLATEGEVTTVHLVPEQDFLTYAGHVGSAFVATHCLFRHDALGRYATRCANVNWDGECAFSTSRTRALYDAARWNAYGPTSLSDCPEVEVLYLDEEGEVHPVVSFT